jgi:2-polyprenyl-3-methyl-5-hydroxy-6-metoxy-1,4-benzoquinol methylase
MTLKDELKQNASLRLENGVFYQGGSCQEKRLRNDVSVVAGKRKSFIPDEIVKGLPLVPFRSCITKEWLVRRTSAEKFISYLRRKTPCKTILEVGCGNGWLSNKMASELSAEVLALDVNETELLQGARTFSTQRLSFVYGDIFNVNLNTVRYDCIVVPSSIQYFQNIQSLIALLLRCSVHREKFIFSIVRCICQLKR